MCTLELSAELSVTGGYWRKLFLPVYGVIFCNFCQACYERRIFNMLNDFVQKWTFFHCVCRFCAISSALNANAHGFFSCFTEIKKKSTFNAENSDSSLLEDLLLLWQRRGRLRAANRQTWIKSWVSRCQFLRAMCEYCSWIKLQRSRPLCRQNFIWGNHNVDIPCDRKERHYVAP